MPDRDRPATLSVAETAELLGISLRATYRAIENGHIPAIRLGRRIRIPTAPSSTSSASLPTLTAASSRRRADMATTYSFTAPTS